MYMLAAVLAGVAGSAFFWVLSTAIVFRKWPLNRNQTILWIGFSGYLALAVAWVFITGGATGLYSNTKEAIVLIGGCSMGLS